jgi:hypothetical protein
LKTTPFETYALMRGQKSGSMFGNTLKVRLVYMRTTDRVPNCSCSYSNRGLSVHEFLLQLPLAALLRVFHFVYLHSYAGRFSVFFWSRTLFA